MKKEKVSIQTEFIKLDSLLKYANLLATGGEAKLAIQDGLVKVNGEADTRRGRKIVSGDIVEYQGEKIQVE